MPDTIELDEIEQGPKYPDIKDAYFRDMCWICGVPYAISTEFLLSRINSKKRIYCPNGHTGIISKEYVKDIEGKIRIPFENFQEGTCCSCGVSFMLEVGFRRQRKGDFKPFHCPNGCQQAYGKPPPPAKTAADVDYEKLIAYHDALGRIALLEPQTWKNKKLLQQAILIARNILELQKVKDE